SETGYFAIACGDFNGDTLVDVFVGNNGGQDVVYDNVPRLSGNIYSDDNTTLSAVTGTITARAYNCTTGAQIGSSSVAATSSYAIACYPVPSNGDMIAVYLDTGTAADRCMTVFPWKTSTAGNQLSIHLRKQYVRFTDNDVAGVDIQQSAAGFANIDAGTNANTIVTSATSTAFTTASGIGVQIKRGPTSNGVSILQLNNNCVVDINGSVLVETTCQLVMQTNGTLNVAGDWTLSGTAVFTKGTGTTVTFDGGTAQTVTSTTYGFNALVASGASTSVVLASTGVSATTSVVVQSNATLGMNSGVTLTTPSVTLSSGGTLQLDSNETLKLDNAGTLTVNSSCTLKIRGTSGAAAATAGTIRGTNGLASNEKWKVVLADGGTLDIRGGRFVDGWIDQNDASPTPAQIALVNTYFYGLPTGIGSAFIELDNVATGRLVFDNLYFTRLLESGASTNCETAALARNISSSSTTSEVHVIGYSGPLGGEAFDDDTNGKIHWLNGITPFKMDLDGAPTNPSSLDEALDSLGTGTTLKLWAHYEDTSGGANVLKSAFGTHVGTLTIPATLGAGDVLELDGFTFMTQNGNATVIDASAAAGTVKLYNCMFVDPWTTAAGSPSPVFINGGTVEAYNCTIDTTVSATSGFDVATDCIEARDYVATPQYFLDYTPTVADLSKRNLHLTKAGHDAIGAPGALVAGHERDIDGKERPSAAASDLGCCYYGSDDSAAIYQTIDDITDGAATTPDAVLSPYLSIVNGPAGCYYATSYDGTNCYLSLINWSNQTIAKKISWTGYRCANPTFVQATDLTDNYLVYVAYAKDQPDRLDTVIRLRHQSSGNDGDPSDDTLSSLGDAGVAGVLSSYDGVTNPDITNGAGWDGQLFLINSFFSGMTEMMVAIATQENNGEIHTFYVSTVSTNGNFYKESTFTTVGVAAESYASGTVNIKPSPYAPVLVSGGVSGGKLIVTRVSEGGGSASTNATLVNLSRSAAQNTVNSFLNANNDQSTSGTSFSAVPGVLTNTNGDLMSAYNGDDRVFQYALDTLTGTWLTDVGLTGYGAPDGVNLCQDAVARVTWVPLYNSTTGNGAVAAIEYAKTGGAGDNDSALELLTNTYADTTMRYHDSAMTHGSFYQGVAHIVGKPVAVVRNITDKGVWCATDAGYLYGWRGSGTYGDATADKGALKTGFPKQFGAPIAYLDFMRCTDNTINAALGFGAGLTKFYLAVKNERGEVTLVRRTA
ncbi:MAG: hypothetical protein L6Q71_03055, partial [Planctomycetes bacterium]|nr:hypothetical protein [Planctomycetota bacterium]